MSLKNQEQLLDDAVAQVHDDPIDPRQIEEAAARVWARLSNEAAQLAAAPRAATAEAAAPVPGASLHGCDDFRALIPAYVRGELTPSRALLVEDHTRTCVPCRRALIEAREGRKHEGAARPAARKPRDPRQRFVWMSLAAALAVALGLGLMTVVQDRLAGGPRMAKVEAIEGTLFRVASNSGVRLGAGDVVGEGDEIRTAKGSSALVRMTDGTLIEMRERAGFAFAASRKGNTIELEGGQVLVHAAKQRQRHLYVSTPDALVSVTGTIFSVNSGVKGSRVSVVEGEVHVEQGGRESVLHPGDQVTTHNSVEKVSIKDEISWSRNAKEYEALLAELTAAGKDIDARVGWPGLRYSTRLLDLSPAGTAVFIALPNVTRNLAQTQQILDEKIADSPSLARWWNESLASNDGGQKFRQMIEKMGQLGADLGPEVAVALSVRNGEPSDPVLLAEVTNEAAFRSTLEAEVARINQQATGGKSPLRIVDDLAAASDTEGLLLWVHQGLFVASPHVSALRQVAAVAAGGANPFAGTAFHGRIAEDYRDGAGWLFAADIANLISKHRQQQAASGEGKTAEALGIYDMQHFIIDRREIDGKAETRAALTFDQERRGIASWLAAPSSMGGLSYFSPDANLVAAFTVKSPVSILNEMLSINPEMARELAEAQTKVGFDVRDDLAATLGGEIAFGVDGPLVPEPSWKLVAEVYDPAHLQQTFESAIARLNDELRARGKAGVTLSQVSSGGRTFYTIKSADPKLEIHYLYSDGYLVAAPSKALLDRTLQQRASGVTIANHPKFRDLLGPDGEVSVSALVYHDLSAIAKTAAKVLPDSVKKQGERNVPDFGKLLSMQGPTLYYAYAEPDRIVIAGSNQNPLGMNLSTLATLGGVLGAVREGAPHQVN